jgi:hypothetical protein
MSNIVELRQYSLKPGMRDGLIALFEREFVESQEETGIDVIGTFHDADDPDRFIWLRGYPDMESRARSLHAFYGGSLWKANRDAAVATMVDSENVLLLRPAWDGSGFAVGGARASRGATELPKDCVVAQVAYFEAPVPAGFVATFRGAMPQRCAAAGAALIAALTSEGSPNNFPAHAIREGEHVFAWFLHFPDAVSAHSVPLPSVLAQSLARPLEVLRLRPTARSRRPLPMKWA